MPMRRRAVVAAVLAIAVLGVAGLIAFAMSEPEPDDGGASPHIVQPGAPGQPGRTLSAGELSAMSAPPHTVADTLFMQQMIQHHAQALQMTALVADHGASEDIRLLAERIEISQRDEIALMQRWLSDRSQPTAGPHADHSGSMPGMLTAEQLSQLERARGAEFDRLFLQFMIVHHQGALTMVERLYAAGGGVEPASDHLAREVVADQTIEIRRMQGMLAERS